MENIFILGGWFMVETSIYKNILNEFKETVLKTRFQYEKF